MLIKMNETHAILYRKWIDYYEREYEKFPNFSLRTSAFFAAKNGENPPFSVDNLFVSE